jgi:hypothetical protein
MGVYLEGGICPPISDSSGAYALYVPQLIMPLNSCGVGRILDLEYVSIDFDTSNLIII